MLHVWMENKNYGHFKNNIITFCKRKVLNIIKRTLQRCTKVLYYL